MGGWRVKGNCWRCGVVVGAGWVRGGRRPGAVWRMACGAGPASDVRWTVVLAALPAGLFDYPTVAFTSVEPVPRTPPMLLWRIS